MIDSVYLLISTCERIKSFTTYQWRLMYVCRDREDMKRKIQTLYALLAVEGLEPYARKTDSTIRVGAGGVVMFTTMDDAVIATCGYSLVDIVLDLSDSEFAKYGDAIYQLIPCTVDANPLMFTGRIFDYRTKEAQGLV